MCGWGAASVNILLTFPINKVMFRQQLYAISAQHALAQLRFEGLIHLYRGMLPPMLMKTTSLSIMFGMYDKYQKVLHQLMPALPKRVNNGSAAILSGCTEALLTPLERVQVLLQDKYNHKLYRNTLHAFSELKPHGFGEYYRGMTPCLLRNGPSNAIFFLLREEVKSLMPKAKTRAGDVFGDFVSGAILGAMISTMFFPLNVVKNQMQCTVGGEFVSMRTAFWIVFNDRDRKWRAMFRGVPVNYVRSLLSWGVINAAYEVLKKQLYPDPP